MRIFITGIAGLIGSAVAEKFFDEGHLVSGCDSNARGNWFGPGGSVEWRLKELRDIGINAQKMDYRHSYLDCVGADIVVHCAGQPSHDFSHGHVVEDFSVNAVGTVALLNSLRVASPKTKFVFISTNKAYGDRVNNLCFVRALTRYRLSETVVGASELRGISEVFPVDRSLHTPFGVSKLAADLMVQEFGRSYKMDTVSFRCGCVSGYGSSGVELHGFLSYLVKCAVHKVPYTIYGYDGYQVRDNIAASDLASAIFLWCQNPKDHVYNMGGGMQNSISVLEAIMYLRDRGFTMEVKYGPPRLGDHKWWITDTLKFELDYPMWKREKTIGGIIDEMVKCETSR